MKASKNVKAVVIALLGFEETFKKAGEKHLELVRTFANEGISKDSYYEAFKAAIPTKEFGVWPQKDLKDGTKVDKGIAVAISEGYVPAIAYNRFKAFYNKFEYDQNGMPIVEGNSFKKATREGQTPNPKGNSQSKGANVDTSKGKETTPPASKPEQESTSPAFTVDQNTIKTVLDWLLTKHQQSPTLSAMISDIAEAEGVKVEVIGHKDAA